MKRVITILIVAACASPAKPAMAQPSKPLPAQPSTGTPKASGVLKAYKGPEGEVVVMLEVNDGKEMLVHLRNIDKASEGKTLLYLFEDQGRGRKHVYVNKKRGSKWYESTILTAVDNRWSFYHPTKPGTHFSLSYSESESETFRADDIIKTYKP
jgi:hypothetical protein